VRQRRQTIIRSSSRYLLSTRAIRPSFPSQIQLLLCLDQSYNHSDLYYDEINDGHLCYYYTSMLGLEPSTADPGKDEPGSGSSTIVAQGVEWDRFPEWLSLTSMGWDAGKI